MQLADRLLLLAATAKDEILAGSFANQPTSAGRWIGIGRSFLLTSAKILFLGCRPLDHGWLGAGRLDWA